MNSQEFDRLYRLGLDRLRHGRLDEAAHLLAQAATANKDSADARIHLAAALTGLKRPEEAVRHCETALSIRSSDPDAHNNLGVALHALGRNEEAAAHYRQALALRPQYPEALNNLGNAVLALGHPEQAAEYYKGALEIRPRYANAHNNLGNAFLAVDRFEDAVREYEAALTIRPIYPEALNNMGDALRALGNIAQAVAAYSKAISLSPTRATFYWNIAHLKRFQADDVEFTAMKQLACRIHRLTTDDQVQLHFALGKAYSDLGDRDRSFSHLMSGNALQRRQIHYDEHETLRRFDRIREVFAPERLRQLQGCGHPSPVPVFIVGMPRAGTTLIEQILASHPHVFGAGELLELEKLASGIRGADGRPFPEAVPTISGEEMRRLGAAYLSVVRAKAPHAARVTDKLPGNFLFVGLIHLMLPNARIIHARRDPRDTALSCFSLLFPKGQEHTYDLAELGRYIRAYERLMDHWNSLLPDSVMLEVQYENLVQDLEAESKRIISHCRLPWDDSCLGFHRTKRPVKTASAAQVRMPIYRTSIGRWREYRDFLEPLLRVLDNAKP